MPKSKLIGSKSNERSGNSCHGPRPQTGVRYSSANGPNSRPSFQIIPDGTTNGMANLKRVKFLDPEFEAPVRDAGSMSAEYLKRKSNLDKSLQKVIDSTRVAHLLVLKKSKD